MLIIRLCDKMGTVDNHMYLLLLILSNFSCQKLNNNNYNIWMTIIMCFIGSVIRHINEIREKLL